MECNSQRVPLLRGGSTVSQRAYPLSRPPAHEVKDHRQVDISQVEHVEQNNGGRGPGAVTTDQSPAQWHLNLEVGSRIVSETSGFKWVPVRMGAL